MHSNMVMIQLIKRRNSSTFISSMSVDRACTKSDSKNDRQRYRDTANSLKNVTTLVNLESQGFDLIINICENTDIIKRRSIYNAGLFLNVTSMIIVNAYLINISAFQQSTILCDDVSLKLLIIKEQFLLNSYRVSSDKF